MGQMKRPMLILVKVRKIVSNDLRLMKIGLRNPPSFASKLTGQKSAIHCPPGFCQNPLVIPSDPSFAVNYDGRPFCPVIYLDLESFQKKCNLDLSPWVLPYMPLLSITTPYSPSIVKVFYHNMVKKEVNDEIILQSSVRGTTIRITARILNSYFGISDSLEDPLKLTIPECFKILFPDKVFDGKPLKFKPSQMSQTYRILWYLYSRNIVNKGRCFTHFVLRDYQFLASIISKEPRNLGKLVISEMSAFISSSKAGNQNTIPYPTLVSQILGYHDVWYLLEKEKKVFPKEFTSSTISFMKMTPSEATSKLKEKLPPDSKPSSSHQPEEGQSSQAKPGSAPVFGPSFAQAAYQTQVQDAVQTAIQPVLQSLEVYQKLTKEMIKAMGLEMVNLKAHVDLSLDTTLSDYRDSLDTRFAALFNQQQEIQKRIQSLEQQQTHTQQMMTEFDITLNAFVISFASSHQTKASSSVMPSPNHEIPTNPATALVLYQPPEPPTVPMSSANSPFLSDDKGGENVEEEEKEDWKFC